VSLVENTACLGAVHKEKTEYSSFLPRIGSRWYGFYLVIYIWRYQINQNTSKNKKDVLKNHIYFKTRYMFRPKMAIVRLCINIKIEKKCNSVEVCKQFCSLDRAFSELK
jgi:hypothetical protein